MPPGEFQTLLEEIQVGGTLDRDAAARYLVRAGYVRTTVVEDPGSFAVRGDIIDVYPSSASYPIRLELFGDEVESLRTFDPQTQRTLRQIEEMTLHPVRETIATEGARVRERILEAADAASQPSKQTRQLLEAIDNNEQFVGVDALVPAFHREMVPLADYLPEDSLWMVLDPSSIEDGLNDQLELADARHQDRLEDHRLSFPPEAHYLSADEVCAQFDAASERVDIHGIELDGQRSDSDGLRIRVDGNHVLRAALERARRTGVAELTRPLADAVADWSKNQWRILIACSSDNRGQRIAGALAEYDVSTARDDTLSLNDAAPGVPLLVKGRLSAGFVSPSDGLVVVSDDEIFGARKRRSQRQRSLSKKARAALLGGVDDFSQIAIDDYLVHDLHGLGQYKGLIKLPAGGTEIDFLHLVYRGGTLYLPVYRMGEVQRYVGAEGHRPRLDKLGGSTWISARKKARADVRALAEELLQLYAQRAALGGHAFPPADDFLRQFEATFEFEETPDQQRAIDEVETDMEAASPMDRLICGDVGYGKTEVAIRALLKAVLGGRQVAMLAPTTVLVEQHFQTMRRRFEGWPVKLARLSRFQPRKQQLETVKGLADGSIDAVVGTHRLLSKDVRFKDLGLLIIDEEQRFGVAHKERLKRMRTQIDVLTLTATPIPRTLHLAMAGLRDLSIIATPPADRRSVRTFVARPEDSTLREGIRRELSRGGQIFFVVPRIDERSDERSLGEWVEHLQTLVPEARIASAHGRMKATALEKAMVGFVDGESDILVSTTIVESGLDIPNANTMFVAQADRFGLAQLYQLRGRIGRSRERAFCYLLVPKVAKLTDEAKRRLETLQRFTDLGAGFAIASQDLEIRGAGELLGKKQSGTIAAVGFDAYTTMLEEAVAELQGQEIHRPRDPELNTDVAAFIPDDYVPDTSQRLDLYKRLSAADTSDDIGEVVNEIADRYGPIRPEVQILADLMILKGIARGLGVQSLELSPKKLALAFAASSPIDPLKMVTLVQKQQNKYRLTADQRLLIGLRADDAESALEQGRSALLELSACVT
jgi:transcription-repair coupling factor (superfamily II helicase)